MATLPKIIDIEPDLLKILRQRTMFILDSLESAYTTSY